MGSRTRQYSSERLVHDPAWRHAPTQRSAAANQPEPESAAKQAPLTQTRLPFEEQNRELPGRQQFLFEFVDHTPPSSRLPRKRSRPRRIRAFIVPRGVPSLCAICSCVSPPKNASSSD